MHPSGAPNPGRTAPRRTPTLRMAIAAGVAVASIYYNQPLLGLISKEYPASGVEGWIPTITQLGYAIGLVVVVPLGDRFERRRLVAVQFAVLAFALAAMAVAPTVALLVLASALVGASATVAQQIVPFAAHLAAPERRGAAVGTVMAGLLTGILLSRTAAGFVAGELGWRAMFWVAVPLVLVVAVLMSLALPRSPAQTNMRYGQLLRSLAALWSEFEELRWAALTQAFLFAAFSAFWTTLALRLEQPPFELGPAGAGAFGVIGVVGVLAAPLAGRLADERGPRLLVALGAALSLLSWCVFGLTTSLAGLIVGVIVLDFGAQIAMVSNQHIIYALDPEARSRLNSVFMAMMFIGGAGGSATATAMWTQGGWLWVATIGIGFSVLALVMQAWLLYRSRTRVR